MPWHLAIDQAGERRLGKLQIGTTQARHRARPTPTRPTGSASACRTCFDPKILRQKIEVALAEKNVWLERVYGVEPIELDELADTLRGATRSGCGRTSPTRRCSSTARCATASASCSRAPTATLLDIDHGTYPFVTSSTDDRRRRRDRHRHRPDPDRRGDRRREGVRDARRRGAVPDRDRGARPGARARGSAASTAPSPAATRRCGWLDLVALRYAVRLNGITVARADEARRALGVRRAARLRALPAPRRRRPPTSRRTRATSTTASPSTRCCPAGRSRSASELADLPAPRATSSSSSGELDVRGLAGRHRRRPRACCAGLAARAGATSRPRRASSAGCGRPPTDGRPGRRRRRSSRPRRSRRRPAAIVAAAASRLGEHRVDLRRRADVVRSVIPPQPPPSSTPLSSASRSRPGERRSRRLEEDDVVAEAAPSASPAPRRSACALQVGDAERDDADALLHQSAWSSSGCQLPAACVHVDDGVSSSRGRPAARAARGEPLEHGSAVCRYAPGSGPVCGTAASRRAGRGERPRRRPADERHVDRQRPRRARAPARAQAGDDAGDRGREPRSRRRATVEAEARARPRACRPRSARRSLSERAPRASPRASRRRGGRAPSASRSASIAPPTSRTPVRPRSRHVLGVDVHAAAADEAAERDPAVGGQVDGEARRRADRDEERAARDRSLLDELEREPAAHAEQPSRERQPVRRRTPTRSPCPCALWRPTSSRRQTSSPVARRRGRSRGSHP